MKGEIPGYIEGTHKKVKPPTKRWTAKLMLYIFMLALSMLGAIRIVNLATRQVKALVGVDSTTYTFQHLHDVEIMRELDEYCSQYDVKVEGQVGFCEYQVLHMIETKKIESVNTADGGKVY